MNLILLRKEGTETETMGELYIDGSLFCYTLEDPIRDKKIKHETCIPYGEYYVKVTYSPAFKKQLPLIYNNTRTLEVEADNGDTWSGIRIHNGNFYQDTSGCILVGFGRNTIPGDTITFRGVRVSNWITNSVAATNELTSILSKEVHRLSIVYDLKHSNQPKVYYLTNPMMKDNNVYAIQKAINTALTKFMKYNPKAGDHILVEDGWFGPKTDEAVRALQFIEGLASTGVVDEAFANSTLNIKF